MTWFCWHRDILQSLNHRIGVIHKEVENYQQQQKVLGPVLQESRAILDHGIQNIPAQIVDAIGPFAVLITHLLVVHFVVEAAFEPFLDGFPDSIAVHVNDAEQTRVAVTAAHLIEFVGERRRPAWSRGQALR